ncbi:MAG: phytanoyl-CoA dioxygenase family protein [Planctomycetaceae bacterium]|nr:phytanoyl-CoA dioxygenase family protein [Planctomycetaceae bacterium]
MLSSEQIDAVAQHGFCVVSDVLSQATVSRYIALTEIARSQSQAENVSNNSGTYGLRNLVDVIPDVAELAGSAEVRQLVEPILGADAFMVRATLFDKTQGANWGVFWHQDLSIAVTQRHEVDGYGAWTKKAGVPCVQPPTEVMADMLAVRLHLDDCHAGSGALKVLPGTHRHDRLASADVDRLEGATEHVLCEVGAGGAVLMRPLLLHASSPMETASSRRVIHLEYANCRLPAPLQWAWQIGPTSVS